MIPIYLTDGKPKRKYMKKLGVKVHIWIDDFYRGKIYASSLWEVWEYLLTNVYDFDETHLLLEKRSYGLEYYCGAIKEKSLTRVPDIRRIGVLDEEDNAVERPGRAEIYSGEEPDVRFL